MRCPCTTTQCCPSQTERDARLGERLRFVSPRTSGSTRCSNRLLAPSRQEGRRLQPSPPGPGPRELLFDLLEAPWFLPPASSGERPRWCRLAQWICEQPRSGAWLRAYALLDLVEPARSRFASPRTHDSCTVRTPSIFPKPRSKKGAGSSQAPDRSCSRADCDSLHQRVSSIAQPQFASSLNVRPGLACGRAKAPPFLTLLSPHDRGSRPLQSRDHGMHHLLMSGAKSTT